MTAITWTQTTVSTDQSDTEEEIIYVTMLKNNKPDTQYVKMESVLQVTEFQLLK